MDDNETNLMVAEKLLRDTKVKISTAVCGMQLDTELLRHLPKELVNITNTAGAAGEIEAPVLTHRKKLPIMISTDSVCDLPREFTEKHQMHVIYQKASSAITTNCGPGSFGLIFMMHDRADKK